MIIISLNPQKGSSCHSQQQFQVSSQSISGIGVASIACVFFVVAVLSVVVAINCSRSSTFATAMGLLPFISTPYTTLEVRDDECWVELLSRDFLLRAPLWTS
jgi:hypothetical protein